MTKRKQKHVKQEEEEQIGAAEGMAKPKQKHVKKQKELIVAAEKPTLQSCSSHHKSRSTDDGEDATLLNQPVKKPRASSTYGIAKRKQKHIKKQKELIVAAEKSTLRSCSSHHKSRSTNDGEDGTLLDQPTKKMRASATYAKCDDESKEAVKNFNYEEYNNFYKSFNSEVANSVAGTMGKLYKATYRGVVRVTVVDLDQQIKSQGNAFVVCKKKRGSILLTCAHIFGDSESSKSVYVVTSDFKCFMAKVWHISKGMDICLLIVKDDLGSNVVELNTWCDEVNFMEDVFSISCPGYKMNVEKSLFSPSDFEKDLAHTLWFTLTKGYVSHPFLVGNHPRNLDGILFQMHGCSWGASSSGAPILSMKGKAIGMYVGSTSDSDALNVKHWALQLNSVRDYLEKIFEVPEKENSLKNMLWRCLEEKNQAKAVMDNKVGCSRKSSQGSDVKK